MRAGRAADPPGPLHRPLAGVVGLLVGTVVFALAGLLGRATVVDGRTLSLVWPATGVGMLMVAAVERRDRVVAVGLVAVATFLLNDLTGASAVLSLVFVLSNVAQAVVGGLLVHEVARRLLRPAPRPATRRRPGPPTWGSSWSPVWPGRGWGPRWARSASTPRSGGGPGPTRWCGGAATAPAPSWCC